MWFAASGSFALGTLGGSSVLQPSTHTVCDDPLTRSVLQHPDVFHLTLLQRTGDIFVSQQCPNDSPTTLFNSQY